MAINSGAFASSWTPKLASQPGHLTTKRCSRRPTMELISHEKLDVLFASDVTETARYRLEIRVPGSVSKATRKLSIQTMKKNASFKGFRKGTIPPFIMKDMESFVMRDTCNDMIESAIKELKLSKVEDEESLPEMDEKSMKRRFIVGHDFTFTCEMKLRATRTPVDGDELPPEVISVADEDILEGTTIDAFVDPDEAEAKQTPSANKEEAPVKE